MPFDNIDFSEVFREFGLYLVLLRYILVKKKA